MIFNMLMIMVMVLIFILPREDFPIGEREALAVCWKCFGQLGHSPDGDENGRNDIYKREYEYDTCDGSCICAE